MMNLGLGWWQNAGVGRKPVEDNWCLQFGETRYLDGTSIVLDNNNKLCLAIRIYVNDFYDASYEPTILIKHDNRDLFQFYFYLDADGNVYTYFELYDLAGGDTSAYSSTAYLTDTWYTVHVIIDRTQVNPNDTAKLYVNGVNDPLTFSGNAQTPFGDGGDYAIQTGLNTKYKLDYVALLVDNVWSQSKINKMVSEKLVWPYTYYWPINEGAGNTIHDIGKNAKHLTNNGGAWTAL